MPAPELLTESTVTAVVAAPLASIDLGEWLFHLTDAEYQRCAPGDHVAAGTTTTDDGRLMSINVEYVGGSLLVQHYVGEVVSPNHCRLVSTSDSFTPVGRTTLGVTWELTVTADGDERSLFSNRVIVSPTDDYRDLLHRHRIPLERAVADQRTALETHNALETPLYAGSIARAASAHRR